MAENGFAEKTNDESLRDPEWEDARSLTALYSNRFVVRVEPIITRIAFGEIIDGATRHHTALAIPTGDAVELALLLLRLAGHTVELKAADQVDGE